MDNTPGFKKGQVVIAQDDIYGSYIGIFQSKHQRLQNMSNVQVLACTVYPSQNAILYRQVAYERKPHDFRSIHMFDADKVLPYEGPIPEYKSSVVAALNEAVKAAEGEGNLDIKVKLKRHILEIA